MDELLDKRLTEDQKEAIQRAAPEIVVRAGAGSGKTTVLVRRYAHLVLERGLKPADILAVTFTEKAAAEMKERTAEIFYQRNLPDLVAELNAAPICTLHSYCSKLITPFCLELGIDPGFAILDPTDAGLLQEQALAVVLRDWRQQQPEDLQYLVRKVHWGGDFGLRSETGPDARGFSRRFIQLVEAVRAAGKWTAAPLVKIIVDQKENLQLVRQFSDDLSEVIRTTEFGTPTYQKAAQIRSLLQKYTASSPPEGSGILPILNEIGGIPNRGSRVFQHLFKRFKEDVLPRLFDACFERNYNRSVGILNRLYGDFRIRYDDLKRIAGTLDFSDLEELTLKLMTEKDDVVSLKTVLIDEAQDLNPLQWEILHRLSQDCSVFAVGDVQQSIYGFRHADAGLFAEFARQVAAGSGQEIQLKANFRSRPPMLEGVNRVFEALWADAEAPLFLQLEARRERQENDQIELLAAASEERDDARLKEAKLLARRFRELMQDASFRVGDEKALRKPQWGDFLVLVRSSGSYSSLEAAFNEAGIPYTIHAGRGFWDAMEVSDLLHLIRCLEDPGDDLSFACLLKSPGAGFSDDDLLSLRFAPPSDLEAPAVVRSFYRGLHDMADDSLEGSELHNKACRFLAIFDALYERKDRLLLREIIERWIKAAHLEVFWSRHPDGELIKNNVRKFLRLCDAAGDESATDLHARFEELRRREPHEGGAPDAGADSGAVQIMTVHGAKGLEAPVVAVVDLNYQARPGDATFPFSRQAGAALCMNDEQMATGSYRPGHFSAITLARKKQDERESERILYVAMTRARDKLLLSASCAVGDKGLKRTSGWLKTISDALNLDPENIFRTDQAGGAPVSLYDRHGDDTGLLLRRYTEWDALPDEAVQRKPVMEAVLRPGLLDDLPKPVPDESPVSVTAWIHRQYEPEERDFVDLAHHDTEVPESEMTGSQIGRWVHRVLQVADLYCQGTGELRNVIEQEGRNLFGQAPSTDQADHIVRLMQTFLDSPLAGLINTGSTPLREYPLLFKLEGHLFKATIDLAFETDDGWVLVDFKSDRIVPRSVEEIDAVYRDQMLLYTLGWELLTGQRPCEAVIFYLQTGTALPVYPSEADIGRIKSTLKTG